MSVNWEVVGGMKDTDVPDGNVLMDKVKINLNMLGVLVLNGVGGEVDGTDVVTVNQSDLWQGAAQLHKQLMKPTLLYHIVGHGAVLHLYARTGDDTLTLWEPGNEVVTQEHRVAYSGSASVGTTGPINISVDDEVQRRGMVKE
jgi:hypothetical protein